MEARKVFTFFLNFFCTEFLGESHPRVGRTRFINLSSGMQRSTKKRMFVKSRSAVVGS